MSIKHLILLLVSVGSLLSANSWSLAFASQSDGSEGSLDAMWQESGGESKPASENVAGAAAASKGFCSLDTFLKSEFMTSVPWQGLGPFQADQSNPSQFADSSHNNLSLVVNDQRIAAVMLELSNKLASGARFINLEMATDYLLEALGGKPGLIHELNMQMEKNTEPLAGVAQAKINLSAGPYLVEIANNGSADDAKELKPAFRIQVKENAIVPKQSIAAVTSPSGERGELKGGPGSGTTNGAASLPASESTSAKEDTAALNDGGRGQSGSDSDASKVVSDSQMKAQPTEVSDIDKNTVLKDELLAVIKSWQSLKKTAVRERQTDDLSKVLAGRALARQSDAIKWLVANHKYYDMNPKSAAIDRVIELVPNKKYAVYARVKESTKYIDDTNGQVLKESDDIYNVNYTLEKATDHWVITDSAILKGGSNSPNQIVKKTH